LHGRHDVELRNAGIGKSLEWPEPMTVSGISEFEYSGLQNFSGDFFLINRLFAAGDWL
jgi:hypothetical protein